MISCCCKRCINEERSSNVMHLSFARDLFFRTIFISHPPFFSRLSRFFLFCFNDAGQRYFSSLFFYPRSFFVLFAAYIVEFIAESTLSKSNSALLYAENERSSADMIFLWQRIYLDYIPKKVSSFSSSSTDRVR